MTLDDAQELRSGDLVTDEFRGAKLVVLDRPYSDFDASTPAAQWRLPVLNLETGSKEFWPNGRWDELERWDA